MPRIYHEVYEDCDSLMTNDPSIGSQIWEEVMNHLPVSYLDNSLIGRSHRVRFIRELSQNSIAFPKHFDEIEAPYPLERFSCYEITSQLTILIYLNEGFVGGTAQFYLNDKEYREVIPKPGRMVVFDRRILHCALPLIPQPHQSSSQPSSSSGHCDKYFLKCCALYGRRRPELSSIGVPTDRSLLDETSHLIELLGIFEKNSDVESKVCSPSPLICQLTLFSEKECHQDF